MVSAVCSHPVICPLRSRRERYYAGQGERCRWDRGLGGLFIVSDVLDALAHRVWVVSLKLTSICSLYFVLAVWCLCSCLLWPSCRPPCLLTTMLSLWPGAALWQWSWTRDFAWGIFWPAPLLSHCLSRSWSMIGKSRCWDQCLDFQKKTPAWPPAQHWLVLWFRATDERPVSLCQEWWCKVVRDGRRGRLYRH